MDSFAKSRKYKSLNTYRGVMYHGNENDEKIEKELTCQFKIGIRNLTNFDPSTQKSQKFALYRTAFDQSI